MFPASVVISEAYYLVSSYIIQNMWSRKCLLTTKTAKMLNSVNILIDVTISCWVSYFKGKTPGWMPFFQLFVLSCF